MSAPDPDRTATRPDHDATRSGASSAGPTVSHPAPDPTDGPSLGRVNQYELLEVLGRGGMGIVYLAHDPGPNRTVALKRMPAGAELLPEFLDRFKIEAEAVGNLDHPNVIPIYEFNVHDGRPFFTMKYLAGGTLSERRPVYRGNPRAAVALVATIARAVQHAHDRKVVHRDLKPTNILFDDAGQPVISDFGLAKLMDLDPELTRSGAFLGTAQYMAPEQKNIRRGAVGYAADVWALGVILHELVTGRRPNPDDDTPREPDGAAAPAADAPALDPGLDAIIYKCLRDDPADRWPSAAALADDLGRWLRGEPHQAPPRPKRLTLTRRALLLAGVGSLAALAGGQVILDEYWPWRDDPETIRKELAREDRVNLLRDNGNPKWWKRVSGRVKFFALHDGEEWQLGFERPSGSGLLELLEGPSDAGFRLCADIRMDAYLPASATGSVGLYVGRSEQGEAGARYLRWLSLSFSDDGTDDPAAERNLARLEAMTTQQGRGNVVHSRSVRLVPTPSRWHRLEIELTADRVAAEVDGRELEDIAQGERRRNEKFINGVGMGRVDRDFRVTDGVGLFVRNCRAAVRNVRLEKAAGA